MYCSRAINSITEQAAGPALFGKNSLLSHDIKDIRQAILTSSRTSVWSGKTIVNDSIISKIVGKLWRVLLYYFPKHKHLIPEKYIGRSKQREKFPVLLNEFTAKLIWFWQFGAFKNIKRYFVRFTFLEYKRYDVKL